MIYQRIDPFTIRQIHEILRPDVQSATSKSDLKNRFLQKGYGLRRSSIGLVLTSEPQGVPLFSYTVPLPEAQACKIEGGPPQARRPSTLFKQGEQKPQV